MNEHDRPRFVCKREKALKHRARGHRQSRAALNPSFIFNHFSLFKEHQFTTKIIMINFQTSIHVQMQAASTTVIA